MNILLVYPWYRYASVVTFEEPLGILYLASVLMKAGYKVKVADLTFQRKLEGLEAMARWADVVGVSSTTPLFGTAVEILHYIKKSNPGIRTVVGGPHVTADPDDALSRGFDVAVIGEGEYSFRDLLRGIEKNDFSELNGIAFRKNGKVKVIPKTEFIDNLDELPFPARHLLPMNKYFEIGEAFIVTRKKPQ